MQCHKYLWTIVHAKGTIPKPDAATQFTFDQGHEVGVLAKHLFPRGIDIPTDNFSANLRITRESLSLGRPLFEAGISAHNLYCRPDILSPAGTGGWDLLEVKSSTGVKDVNIWDAAFQRLCCQAMGLKIRSCSLVYINNKYVRHGDLDPRELFTVEDITGKVDEYSFSLEERVGEIASVMRVMDCPEPGIGPHCSEPYPCPLHDICWTHVPEHSIFELYDGGKRCFELYRDGIHKISEIPPHYGLEGKQRIQFECVTSGEAHVDYDNINSFISSLQFPLYFLDFETFGAAIPLFDGVKPFQPIPFQFSLHMLAEPGGEAVQYSYLADGQADPRPALVARLKEVLGEEGSILAYSAAFEKKVLREIGEAFHKYGEWTESLQGRVVDLLKPFSSFHYYHPLQKGSASLKSVMPVLAGLSYGGLDIGDGRMAAAAYMAATYGQATDEDKARIRSALEEYCGQDTGGMVEIIRQLIAIAGGN